MKTGPWFGKIVRCGSCKNEVIIILLVISMIVLGLCVQSIHHRQKAEAEILAYENTLSSNINAIDTLVEKSDKALEKFAHGLRLNTNVGMLGDPEAIIGLTNLALNSTNPYSDNKLILDTNSDGILSHNITTEYNHKYNPLDVEPPVPEVEMGKPITLFPNAADLAPYFKGNAATVTNSDKIGSPVPIVIGHKMPPLTGELESALTPQARSIMTLVESNFLDKKFTNTITLSIPSEPLVKVYTLSNSVWSFDKKASEIESAVWRDTYINARFTGKLLEYATNHVNDLIKELNDFKDTQAMYDEYIKCLEQRDIIWKSVLNVYGLRPETMTNILTNLKISLEMDRLHFDWADYIRRKNGLTTNNSVLGRAEDLTADTITNYAGWTRGSLITTQADVTPTPTNYLRRERRKVTPIQ